MTTAHRPTFDPARGKEAARGEAYHQRLLPAHKTLKFRQQGQGNASEQAKRDLKAELLRNEARHHAKREGRELADDEGNSSQSLHIGDRSASTSVSVNGKRKLSDAAADDGDSAQANGDIEEDYEAKKRRVLEETRDIDASDSDSSSSSSDESDDESEDETAALMAELAKIKAERAEQAAKEAAEKAKRDEEQREKDIALGNPLLNKQEYGVRRRWDDDVVFKNQARGTEERGKEKRFVNDLLRSDFHKRFMDKYVR